MYNLTTSPRGRRNNELHVHPTTVLRCIHHLGWSATVSMVWQLTKSILGAVFSFYCCYKNVRCRCKHIFVSKQNAMMPKMNFKWFLKVRFIVFVQMICSIKVQINILCRWLSYQVFGPFKSKIQWIKVKVWLSHQLRFFEWARVYFPQRLGTSWELLVLLAW